jgi:hypothetical protein
MTRQPDAEWWPLKFRGGVATIECNGTIICTGKEKNAVPIRRVVIERLLADPASFSYHVSVYPKDAYAQRVPIHRFEDLFSLRVYLMSILKKKPNKRPP